MPARSIQISLELFKDMLTCLKIRLTIPGYCSGVNPRNAKVFLGLLDDMLTHIFEQPKEYLGVARVYQSYYAERAQYVGDHSFRAFI